jgi:hypothetical protein
MWTIPGEIVAIVDEMRSVQEVVDVNPADPLFAGADAPTMAVDTW